MKKIFQEKIFFIVDEVSRTSKPEGVDIWEVSTNRQF
jgi:hypothetical protein